MRITLIGVCAASGLQTIGQRQASWWSCDNKEDKLHVYDRTLTLAWDLKTGDPPSCKWIWKVDRNWIYPYPVPVVITNGVDRGLGGLKS